MNEEAIKDSYNLFVADGYAKSFEEFKNLLATNPNALKDSYNLFVSDGYGKSIDDYKSLMGVGGKSTPVKKNSLWTRLWKLVHRNCQNLISRKHKSLKML